MYALKVYFPDDQAPRHVEHVEHAPGVPARVSELLHEHEGCEQVVVFAEDVRLFSVDGEGKTKPN